MQGHGTPPAKPSFQMHRGQDGIVRLVWGAGVRIGYQDAIEATDMFAQLAGDRPAPLLVDMRAIGETDRQARAVLLESCHLAVALALLAGTPLSRIMANLFISLAPRRGRVRLFHDEAAATSWLLEESR